MAAESVISGLHKNRWKRGKENLARKKRKASWILLSDRIYEFERGERMRNVTP